MSPAASHPTDEDEVEEENDVDEIQRSSGEDEHCLMAAAPMDSTTGIQRLHNRAQNRHNTTPDSQPPNAPHSSYPQAWREAAHAGTDHTHDSPFAAAMSAPATVDDDVDARCSGYGSGNLCLL
jgi:hypothetical protein